MEKQSNLREIKFNDLWRIFVSRLWIIMLSSILVLIGFYTINKFTYVPKYESTATLYILRQSTENSTLVEQKATEDFSLALNVVNDCDYLLRSHVVLDEVINNLDLDISYEALSDCVKTSNPDDTRILQVTVEAATPETAKLVVDQICEIGEGKIEKAMGFDQVNLYEEGVIDYSPSNRISLMTYILVALVVAVAVYSIYLLRYLFDDRIKTDEEIERYLNLTIIGDIPNAYRHKRKKDSYYAGYGNYGYGYGYGKNKYSYGYGYKYRYKYKHDKIPDEPMTPNEVFIDKTEKINIDTNNDVNLPSTKSKNDKKIKKNKDRKGE
ncbi:MAG: hypothetical protein IKU52_05790 [Clostridia bacterium]|nr:hypothetical protein [Clostridia bacterium]